MKSFVSIILFAFVIVAGTEAFNALRSKRQNDQNGVINNNNNGQPQCFGGPLTPLNGQLSYSTGSIFGPWPAGATATLLCNAGYILNGAATSVCQNGIFNPVGTCIPANNGGIGIAGVPLGAPIGAPIGGVPMTGVGK